MTVAGKNKEFRLQSPSPNGLAAAVQHCLAGNLAICEPWFGDGSLILSRASSEFKVRVINDQKRCLVALFEMLRIDQQALFELAKHEHVPKKDDATKIFYDKSPFLESLSDVMNGIDGFFTCIKNMGISRVEAIESESSFYNAVHTIHDKLEQVLVENLPVDEFIPRFDKPYVIFFISHQQIMSLIESRSIMAYYGTLKGRLLVQCNSSSIDSFKSQIIASSNDRLVLDFKVISEKNDFLLGFKARA